MSERALALLDRIISSGPWASPMEWKAWRDEYAALPRPMSPGWPMDMLPVTEPRGREEWPGGMTSDRFPLQSHCADYGQS